MLKSERESKLVNDYNRMLASLARELNDYLKVRGWDKEKVKSTTSKRDLLKKVVEGIPAEPMETIVDDVIVINPPEYDDESMDELDYDEEDIDEEMVPDDEDDDNTN